MADQESEISGDAPGWAPPASTPVGGIGNVPGPASNRTKRPWLAIAVAAGVVTLVLAGLVMSRTGDDGDSGGEGVAGGLLNDLGIDQPRKGGTTSDAIKSSIEAAGAVLAEEFGFERNSDAVVLSSEADKENQNLSMELCAVSEEVSGLDGVAYQAFQGDVGHHQAVNGFGYGDENALRVWAEKAYDLASTFRDDPANCAIGGTDGAILVGEPTVEVEKSNGAVATVATFHLEEDGNLLQVGLVVVQSGDWAYLSAISLDEANALPDAEFGAALRRVIAQAVSTIQG